MTDFVLNRWGGMRDVLMALGAVKALKSLGHTAFLMTSEEYTPMVQACPHVEQHLLVGGVPVDLNPARHGLAIIHQIDSYLLACGVEPFGLPPESKTIDIDFGSVPRIPGRVGIHENGVDPNRRYQRWEEVAQMLLDRGIEYVEIDKKSSMMDSLRLIASCSVFVSADSGPIQMAAAARTPIVGIYSVVGGRQRLPFNTSSIEITPSCRHYPCYQAIADREAWNEHSQPYGKNLAKALGEWCRMENKFDCMYSIDPAEVVDSIVRLL